MRDEGEELTSLLQVPDSNRAVRRRRNESTVIGCESEMSYPGLVTLEDANFLPSVVIPDSDCVVRGTGDDSVSSSSEKHYADWATGHSEAVLGFSRIEIQ
jgi:hypothetical protein